MQKKQLLQSNNPFIIQKTHLYPKGYFAMKKYSSKKHLILAMKNVDKRSFRNMPVTNNNIKQF